MPLLAAPPQVGQKIAFKVSLLSGDLKVTSHLRSMQAVISHVSNVSSKLVNFVPQLQSFCMCVHSCWS